MTVFTLWGDSKAMIVIIVPPVIFGQRKASTLGSSTHTTPLSISSISKFKDNINADVKKDYSQTFGTSTNATPSIFISSLNATPKESISDDGNIVSNKTKTVSSIEYILRRVLHHLIFLVIVR